MYVSQAAAQNQGIPSSVNRLRALEKIAELQKIVALKDSSNIKEAEFQRMKADLLDDR